MQRCEVCRRGTITRSVKLRVKSLSADGESVVVLVKGHDHEETVPATDIIKPKLTVEHVKAVAAAYAKQQGMEVKNALRAAGINMLPT